MIFFESGKLYNPINQSSGNESPYPVHLIMETVYRNNRKRIQHIGSQNFGIQYFLKGIYSHNDLLFFHLQLKKILHGIV
ncbi:MAG: conjugative transposon protein TraN [Prevotellaceae bacterium]|nr:conjugative transposon protein TraN [Prevotellaceae bacterium]